MRASFPAGLIAIVALAGCGEKPKPPVETAPPAPASSGPITPCATCKVVEIGMVTTEKGNYFEPKNVEAHVGDVLRYKLVVGVHNVSFPADSNAGKSGLPATTQLLQLPGQTSDILLNFGTGTFRFQCDAHAALGMTGAVTVEDKKP